MVGVYPNPSNGLFNINLNQSVKASFKVIDVLGKTVRNGSFDRNEVQIDLSGFPEGLYTLMVEWDGGVESVRLKVL